MFKILSIRIFDKKWCDLFISKDDYKNFTGDRGIFNWGKMVSKYIMAFPNEDT